MIKAKDIRNGINRGIVRFISDPNANVGTVCSIGEHLFYFGGETAAEESPLDYIRNVPIEDIVAEVLTTLDDFRAEGGEFADEYAYYEAILKEAAAGNPASAPKKVKKYILVEYIEPDVSEPFICDTYLEALAEMRRRFFEATNTTEANYKEELERDISNGNARLGGRSAWCETMNHDNATWKIFETEIAV